MKPIAIVKNQTVGGGDRYSKNVIFEIKKEYDVKVFSPKTIDIRPTSKINRFFRYLNYVYIYLPKYYKDLGKFLSEDDNYKKIIVFQDAYRKCPDIFLTLRKNSVYILHEPPREFYEPLYYHASTIKESLFTLLFRWPIFFSDQSNTQKATSIVANSNFSKYVIKKIYKKNSHVIYPGFSLLSNNKPKRNYQCLSVGSLLPYKGHDLVIKAIGLIEGNKPNLVIVGTGSKQQKMRLNELAKKSNVHIDIISKPSDKKLGDIYRTSRVYVNSAFREPFGMTSLEAVGHGCNLVTVNSCGTQELKKYYPKNVFISDRSPEELSNKISLALNRPNREVSVKYFSWERVSREIVRYCK